MSWCPYCPAPLSTLTERLANSDVREVAMPTLVYVFWDNSNIFIEGRKLAAKKEGEQAYHLFRLQFDNLLELAAANRPIGLAYAVGSIPPELRTVWERLHGEGVNVDLRERGAETGREQGVDALLQVRMLRALADASGSPGIAVLLTGDGAGYQDGAGFHADLERMQKDGWAIEVISWDHSCNRALKAWAEKVGVYVKLDDYYESVTFLEGSRKSTPLDISQRPRA